MMFIELRLVIRRQGRRWASRNWTLPCMMPGDLIMLAIWANFLVETCLELRRLVTIFQRLGNDPNPFVPKCLALWKRISLCKYSPLVTLNMHLVMLSSSSSSCFSLSWLVFEQEGKIWWQVVGWDNSTRSSQEIDILTLMTSFWVSFSSSSKASKARSSSWYFILKLA